VADSDPELEDRECRNKARALLTAAAASLELAPITQPHREGPA
jgi:anthranilate/para-aminobenzoate synthase component I